MQLPQIVNLTNAKVADVKQAKKAIEQLGKQDLTVVMDRGYNDYELFAWLSKRNTCFVTRIKENAQSSRLKDDVLEETENYGDYRFSFITEKAKEKCGKLKFRLIQWHDQENDRRFEFITNDFELTAEEVADLYRERWQIELFFKKIKQYLKVKSFIGTNVNAVMSQIWTACIVLLLIEILRCVSKHKWTFPRLLHFVRLNLLTHKKLWDWLETPDIRVRHKQNSPPKRLPMELDFAPL